MRAFLLYIFFILNFSSYAQTIAGGGAHSLAVCNDGTAMAWGNNSHGELGNGTNTDSNVPVQASSLTGIIAIASGFVHSLAVKNDSTAWAWGNNSHGELGNGTNTNSNVPVRVSALTGITTIAGGSGHSLALKNDSTVCAWGWNQYGQLGNGITGGANNIPVPVNSLTAIIAIAGGYNHSLALKNDGTVWAWGWNLGGQLGNGTTTDSNVPVPVSSLTGIISVAGGLWHSVALKNDGTVWAWGWNLDGQLGNGTTIDSNVPVPVSSLTGITAIAGGGVHSLALKNDGTVWAWGRNYRGQLGNGTNTDSNVPIQVIGPCCTPATFTQSRTVCEGQSFLVGNNTYTVSGIYHDTLTSYLGCDSIMVTQLTVNPSPTANVSSNITSPIFYGQSAMLTASGAVSYNWSNGETTKTVAVAPTVTTIYCVTATDANNCSDTACVKVIFYDACASGIYLPNAFSPNNDGENDFLQVYNENTICITSLHIAIYNRWGEKIYESNDPAFKWDGVYSKGILKGTHGAGSEVFTYYLDMKLTGGKEIFRKGNISLVR